MAHATHLNLDSPHGRSGRKIAPLPQDDTQLRETLRYCAPSTYEAARLFRATARAEYVAPILHGILQHYMEPDLRAQLRVPADSLRLQEDLGLDSLTMMEIVIRLEDVLQISIRDDELRQIRTVGEVRALIERTVAAASPPAPPLISTRS
jgi:3-hydroxyacyl-[acyl-carrier-protein] dehydratase